MLSIKRLGKFGSKDKKGAGPLDYLVDSELAKLSYYETKNPQNKELFNPVWHGKGALALKLSGAVDMELIYDLGQGIDPNTKKPLGRSHGDRHQVGQDLTFSAPKSVSVAYVGMDEAQRSAVLKAHQLAVDRALEFIETIAQTRLGKNGVELHGVDGIVAAKFQHFASRELDPQLHTHAVVFNLALREDGKWGTLESNAFYMAKMAAGALYRSELAAQLGELGFGIKPTEKDSFDIDGFTTKQLDEFSKRRMQIEEVLEKKGLSGAKASQLATLSTRKSKDEPPYHELMQEWEKDCAAAGIDATFIDKIQKESAAKPKKEYVLEFKKLQMTAQASHFDRNKLLQAILVDSVGHWNADRCILECDKILASENIVKLQKKNHMGQSVIAYTTTEMLALEAQMKDSVLRRFDERNHSVADSSVELAVGKINETLKEAGGKLNEEQTNALKWITQNTGGCSFVEGWAGTGKTTMLTAVRIAYEAEGYNLLGTAIAGKAAKGLQDEAGIQSKTLASLQRGIDNGSIALNNKSVVVIDEAGMVDSVMFSKLLFAVDKAQAKLVVIGDPKQLQPIAAGGIMRSLMKSGGKQELNNVNRQRTDFRKLRQMLTKALDSKQLNLTKEKKLEFVKSKNPDLRLWCTNSKNPEVLKVYEKWKEKYDYEWMRTVIKKIAKENGNQTANAINELHSKGLLHIHGERTSAIEKLCGQYLLDENEAKDKLIVAATRAEVMEINSTIKKGLQEAGKLDIEAEHYRFYLNKDKTSYRDFGIGDRIIFTSISNKIGVQNGTMGFLKQIKHTDKGIRLILQLDSEKGTGRIVEVDPEAFKNLEHGWAISCHKSQGATVNNAYVMMSETMSDREWLYVAASRARFKSTLFAVEGEVDHLLPENFDKLKKVERDQIELEMQLKLLAERSGKTRAKDTTLDWEVAADDEQAQIVPTDGKKKVPMLVNDKPTTVKQQEKIQAGHFQGNLASKEAEQEKKAKAKGKSMKKDESPYIGGLSL